MIDTLFNLLKWIGKTFLGRIFWIFTLIYQFFKWLFGSFTIVFAVMRGYTFYRVLVKLLSIPVILGLVFYIIDLFFRVRTYAFLNNKTISDYISSVISSVDILNNVIVVMGHSGFLLGLTVMFYFFLVGLVVKFVFRIIF